MNPDLDDGLQRGKGLGLDRNEDRDPKSPKPVNKKGILHRVARADEADPHEATGQARMGRAVSNVQQRRSAFQGDWGRKKRDLEASVCAWLRACKTHMTPWMAGAAT
jgi:hypothetical protein